MDTWTVICIAFSKNFCKITEILKTMNCSEGANAVRENLHGLLCLHCVLIFLNFGVASEAIAQRGKLPPSVIITEPRESANFKFDNGIILAATATDPHGRIRGVDYYEGTNRLASSLPPDFRAFWQSPPLGLHSIVAVATDNRRATYASAPVHFNVTPTNDNFSDATILTGTNANVVGGTIGAVLEAGEPDWNWGGGSVWYSWTAPAHGRVYLTMPDQPYETFFGACTGTTVSNLTRLADNLRPWGAWLPTLYFEAHPETNYYIVVAGAAGPVDAFTLKLEFFPEPQNDDFEHRATIPGLGGTATVDTSFATFQAGEPSDLSPIIVGYSASFHTVWWTWTAPVAGQVNIQPSCDFLYLLGLYSGATLSNLATVATVFYAGANLDVSAGTTLQISLDGVSGQAGLANLSVSFIPRPSNDDFTNSAVAVGAMTTLQSNNTAATLEPGEPQHANAGSGRSVWWQWVAPVSGYVRLSPVTNSVAPVVAVYTGVTVSNLAAVSSSSVGTVGFDAVEGTTYHIAVDGAYGWQGPFTLNLLLSTIQLTTPLSGAGFYVGDPIVLSASTTQLDGDGRSVDFFVGTQFLGSAAPDAKITWTNAELGAYSLTASITDSRGITRRSKPIDIRVRPPNDDFTNSFVIQGLNVVTNGTNLGAGKEPGEPSGGDPAADASVWYSWTAPVPGAVSLGIGENYFGGHPAGVYVGDTVSNLIALTESIYDFYPPHFVAHAGVTYHIEVSGFSQNIPDGAGPFELVLVQTPAPPNDDFANAFVLSGTIARATGSTVGATGEPGEPELGGSAWWNWTAPANGRLQLDFQGSDVFPGVSIYTGLSVSNLTYVPSIYNQSPIAYYNVEAGQTYHIALGAAANVLMNLSLALAPPNDNFADRLPLTGRLATTASSNTTATVETGEVDSNGHTVWWTWTAPVSGPVSLGSGGSSFSPWLTVYTGTVVTNLVQVTNGLSRLTFNALADEVYQISADSNGGGQVGQIALTLVAGLPVNDAFSNRLVLSGMNVTAVGATVGATREPREPVHGGYLGSNSVWWTWTATATGTLTVNITGDGFSPIWALYTGSNLAALSRVADSYDWLWGVRSSVSIPVQPGIPLQIAVDGSPDVGGGPAGIVSVGLAFVGLPPNDDFVNRIVISGSSVHVLGNTSGATHEPGEPAHAGYPGGHSIWWSWTAPTSGRVTLDAAGSAITTLAAVYTGNTVSALTNIVSGNATYAPLEFDCDAGVTYQIAFDHWYSDMFGSVDLNLLFSSMRLLSPTNDAVFHEPDEITLAATNSAWDGTFAQMEFLADGNNVGNSTAAPYTITWTKPSLGDHSLKTRITDLDGVTRFSPTVVIHVRPVNDDFASSTPILADAEVVHASGVNATLEAGEPVHGPVNWQSVWWNWTAPSAGRVTLSKPSDLNFRYVLIGVYTGPDVTDLVLITNTPANGSGTLASTIAFDAVPGATYQFAVAGSFFYLTDVPITFSFARSSSTSDAQSAIPPTVSDSPPVLSPPERLSSTQIRFNLTGRSGCNYVILASPDVTLPLFNWFTLLTTNLAGKTAIIQDNQATNHSRFYRAMIRP